MRSQRLEAIRRSAAEKVRVCVREIKYVCVFSYNVRLCVFIESGGLCDRHLSCALNAAKCAQKSEGGEGLVEGVREGVVALKAHDSSFNAMSHLPVT